MKIGSIAVIDNEQNGREIRRLASMGYNVVRLPPVVLTPVALSAKDLASISAADTFDIAVFSDERAVDLLAGVADAADIDLFVFDGVTTVVSGEPVADRLRFLQLHADIIPSPAPGDGMCEAVKEYLGGEEDLSEASVLIFQTVEMDDGNRIAATLADAGASVTKVIFAEAAVGDGREAAKLKALSIGGGFEAVHYAATYDVYDLALLEALTGADLFSGGATATCPDDLVKDALRERGIEARII